MRTVAPGKGVGVTVLVGVVVGVAVGVRVGVHLGVATVPVLVLVDQVNRQEQVPLA